MKKLTLALYCEGTTDQQFLSTIIQRTGRWVVDQYAPFSVNVEPVDLIIINKAGLKQSECIVQAAYKASDKHILIIHADADAHTRAKALHERFQPGHKLVQQIHKDICKHLVPIIPVYMTEAWMLADFEALQRVIGTSMNVRQPGLPANVKQVELDANPKQTLKQVIQNAYANRSRRHGPPEMGTFYGPLGRTVSLDKLNQLSAYQQFVVDLTLALKHINLIE